MKIKELDVYTNGIFDLVKPKLENDGYEIAYGSTYSIKEVRKSIMDGYPVFTKVRNKVMLVVGENPEGLIVQSANKKFEISDKELRKSWTGNVVIVLNKKKDLLKAHMAMEQGPLVRSEMVIYESDKDKWSEDLQQIKQDARNSISAKIQKIPTACLPNYPVIVVFSNPKGKEQQGAWAYSKGFYIYLLKPDDIIKNFFHELGHIIWKKGMSDTDKKPFKQLFSNIDKKNAPSVFTNDWWLKNVEEMFCAIYMWWSCGFATNKGYHRILEGEFSAGYDALVNLFKRRKDEYETRSNWDDQEKKIHAVMLSLMVKAKTVMIKGRKRILKKAYLSPGIIRLPIELIQGKLLAEQNGNQWVLAQTGMLKGKVLVLTDGYVNFDLMKIHINRVPHEIEINPKSGDSYIRTIMVRPEVLLKAQVKTSVKEEPKRIGWSDINEKGKAFLRRIQGK